MKPSSFDKIVFLDVDGVLNNVPQLRAENWNGWDDENVEHFAHIVNSTNADIVLSSSWRLMDSLHRQVQQKLNEAGIGHKLIDKTIDGRDCLRAVEIRDWLTRHRVRRYAILDDDDDAGALGLAPNFFQTDAREGLTYETAERVIEHLNRPVVE